MPRNANPSSSEKLVACIVDTPMGESRAMLHESVLTTEETLAQRDGRKAKMRRDPDGNPGGPSFDQLSKRDQAKVRDEQKRRADRKERKEAKAKGAKA